MEQKLTLEEHFEAIEEILDKMESKEISLEDSFACYEAGMNHLKECNGLMEQVEKKVQMLNQAGELEDFDEV